MGQAVGCAVTKSNTNVGLMRPNGAASSATRPSFRAREARGGTGLGEAYLAWSRDAGYTSAFTDWRSTILEGRSPWRIGFGRQLPAHAPLIG